MHSSAAIGSDPLRQEIARRVKVIMYMRKLDVDKVADMTGLSSDHINALLAGRGELTQDVCHRILTWFKGGMVSIPYKSGSTIQPGPGWKTVSVKLEPELNRKLLTAKKKLYMDTAEVIHLALTRFLDDQPGMLMLDKIAKQIRKAKVTQLLHEVPEVRDLLEADLDLISALGVKQCVPVEPIAPLPSEELAQDLGTFNRTEEENQEEEV
jgi:transcriptional regulator with XRE-family HTH domain